MKIHDIELAKIQDDKDVSRYEPALEIAAELEVTDVICSIWIKNKNNYLNQFAKLYDYEKQYNLYVNLELVTCADVYDIKK